MSSLELHITMAKAKSQEQNAMVKLVTIKYETFINMIKELNSLASYFVDDNASSMTFCIVSGTDKTFLWKLTVRVDCLRTSVNGNVESRRVLKLNDFINIYNNIKGQYESMKIFKEHLEETPQQDDPQMATATTSTAASRQKTL